MDKPGNSVSVPCAFWPFWIEGRIQIFGALKTPLHLHR